MTTLLQAEQLLAGGVFIGLLLCAALGLLVWCLIIWVMWALGRNAWKVKAFLAAHEALAANVRHQYDVLHEMHKHTESIATAVRQVAVVAMASTAWDAAAAREWLNAEGLGSCLYCRGPLMPSETSCAICGTVRVQPASPAPSAPIS